MICPTDYENWTEVGSVYLVVHKSHDDQTCDIEKRKHFSLAIDITGIENDICSYFIWWTILIGSSTTTDFVATHIDLYITSLTDHSTYVGSKLKSRSWNDYSSITKVGNIPVTDIQKFPSPFCFAKHIEYELISNVYMPLRKSNGSCMWSSTLNCQTFTRLSIEHLQMNFPQDIVFISDIMPTMVDMDLEGSLLTNTAVEKTNEALGIWKTFM